MTVAELPPEGEPLEITLPPLHDSQREVAKHEARFKVVCCGRRWGKTMLGIVLCLRAAIHGGRVWWVAPSYSVALEGWSYLQRLIQTLPLAHTQLSRLRVTIGDGSIEIKTADNPDNLRGSGLDGVVLDEAASMKEDVWDLVLRPALADKQGWALFISTPKHYNWFYDRYEYAESGEDSQWACWQKPTWDNPYIEPSEIEAARRDMEAQDFAQEFGADFTAVGGAIFPLLSANRSYYLRPMPETVTLQRKGVGMDWGTTPQHQAAVVGGGVMSTGTVWITSSWLSDTGSANDWYDEARRVRAVSGAQFARVDRSQSSAVDQLTALGFEADKGIADVEGRIGDLQGLVRRQAVFFDSRDEGVRALYNHLCAYHRIPEDKPKAGQPEEEEDDDVDAACYLVSELVRRVLQGPTAIPVTHSVGRRQQARRAWGKEIG